MIETLGCEGLSKFDYYASAFLIWPVSWQDKVFTMFVDKRTLIDSSIISRDSKPQIEVVANN